MMGGGGGGVEHTVGERAFNAALRAFHFCFLKSQRKIVAE
jgi:hypothetical protein